MFKIVKHIAYIVVFIMSVGISTPEADAATVQAASCQIADVKTAINSANIGDTVSVPPGECTWTLPLVITKGLTLRGAGRGNTIIIVDIPPGAAGEQPWYTHAIRYTPSSPEMNTPFRITGFEINGGGGSNTNDAGGIFIFNTSLSDIITSVRIDNNYIHNFPDYGKKPRCIRWGTFAYGVIDHNELSDCYKTADFGSEDAMDAGWALPFEQGTANQIYVEDNIITHSGAYSGLGGITSGGDGGRYAYRYNTITITNDINASTIWDMHGDAQVGWGTVGTEVYNNTVNFIGTSWHRMFYVRGGTNLLFNNVMTQTNDNANLVHLKEEGGINSPAHDVKNTFIWNNVFNGVVNRGGGVFILSGTRDLQEGVDFWSDDGGNISAGLEADLPTTCTINTYYGTTDPASTRWKYYKCTSTDNWTLQYTTYIYPHPLTTGTIDTMAPAPPTLLIVR